MKRLSLIALGAMLIATTATGCGDDTSGTEDSNSGTDGGDGDGDGGDGDGDGDGDGGDGDGDGETFEPFGEDEWARGGIRIERVEINQGSALTVVQDGTVLPAEDRGGANIVRDRQGLLQAFWEVPGDWQARDITATLHVATPEGLTDAIDDTVTVDGPSTSGSLNTSFSWFLPAQAMVPGLEFFIELREAGDADGIEASSERPGTPSSGMEEIGIPADRMELKVTVYPVDYDSGGNCVTNNTQDVMNNANEIRNFVFKYNPVSEVILTVADEPIVMDEQLTSLTQLWGPLQALRFNNFAEPNEYYYAFANVCGGGVDGAAGIAPGTPGPVKGAGDSRVSSGIWAGLNSSLGTYVHELGHNQGRPHSPCGGPDGPDPNYPHANARLGSWGYDVVTGTFKNPQNHADYMAYCGPDWVSDYVWAQTYNQINVLTSWDYPNGPDPEEDGGDIGHTPRSVDVMHGLIYADGTEDWWVLPGLPMEAEIFDTDETIRYYAGGELAEETPMKSWLLEDGKTIYVTAPAPADFELMDSAERTTLDMTESIDVAAVKLHPGIDPDILAAER